MNVLTPSNEEIVQKYQTEIIALKQELVKITKFDNLPDRRKLYILEDMDYNMLVKGYKNRRTEVEVLIHQRYAQIGRLMAKMMTKTI